ncbi:MAG: ABC transporter ATP-binding protein [Pseudomonadota bacterium]
MTNPIIQIQDLHKSYSRGFFRKSSPVLNNICLEINSGEAWALIGPNGAGKTTMLHCLLGFLKPDSGFVKIFNKIPTVTATKKRIGFQSEIFYTYDFLTAHEVLTFYGSLSGIKKIELSKRISKYLKLLNLFDVKDVKVKNFSKGMLQRLGIANSLLKEPDIIIWDEPCSGLDPEGRLLITTISHQLISEGKTLLFSSHVLSEVESICNHVCLIKNGKILLNGNIDEIKSHSPHKSLEDIYMGHVK